MKNVRPKHKNS